MTKRNVINAVIFLLLLAILLVPSAKAMLIQGLMQVGLFRPSIGKTANESAVDLQSIKFKDINGKLLSLADCKGKVVFLNFWATWCPPCIAEMPSINRFYEQFKDKDVVFIMVDADSDFSKAQAFLDRKKYKLPLHAAASSMPKSIFNGALPTTLVFDRKGRISFQGEGAANYSSKKFTDFVEQLLKQDVDK